MTLPIGRQGVPGDVGGHIIGHQFLGEDSGAYNVVPMNGRPDPSSGASNLNQGPYLSLEREIATWVSLGMEVEVDVQLDWRAPNRPDHLRFEFTVDDPTTSRIVVRRFGDFDNAPGQDFAPLTSSNMQLRIEESRTR